MWASGSLGSTRQRGISACAGLRIGGLAPRGTRQLCRRRVPAAVARDEQTSTRRSSPDELPALRARFPEEAWPFYAPELPQHAETVRTFRIDRTLVTDEAFASFSDRGAHCVAAAGAPARSTCAFATATAIHRAAPGHASDSAAFAPDGVPACPARSRAHRAQARAGDIAGVARGFVRAPTSASHRIIIGSPSSSTKTGVARASASPGAMSDVNEPST